MKIYTKTGDQGQTSLYRGGRIHKDHQRLNACGTVDELNSHIGWVRSQGLPDWVDKFLDRVQNDLFIIGADIATPLEKVDDDNPSVMRLESNSELFMEEAIDQMDEELPPLKQFILPGGSAPSSALHIARAVCRRSERETVALNRTVAVNPSVVIYLNRLSDLLFTTARYLNRISGMGDTPWEKKL